MNLKMPTLGKGKGKAPAEAETSSKFMDPPNNNPRVKLWCNVEGDTTLFSVEPTPEQSVADVKELIHHKAIGDGQPPLAKDLVLWRVSDSYQQGWHGANRT